MNFFTKRPSSGSDELQLIVKKNKLKLLVENSDLKNVYEKNKNLTYESDSGFDLFFPREIIIPPGLSFEIKLGIRCSMFDFNEDNVGYMLVPRSSISKTPLRLANSIGIIDAHYRGEIIVKVDNHSLGNYTIQKHQRLFQLVSFNGYPIDFKIVPKLEETKRGDKGFGSTGK